MGSGSWGSPVAGALPEAEAHLEVRRRRAVGGPRLALEPRQHVLAKAPRLALPQEREAGGAPGHQALEGLVGHLQGPGPVRLGVLHRQLAAVPALAQEALGHVVERRPALEGVDAPALLGLERGLEAQHVLEHVLEAAARVDREPARGHRPAPAERVDLLRDRLGQLVEEPVVAGQPSRPAGLGREARLLEEGRAGGDGLRGGPVAGPHPGPVALAAVEGVLEGQRGGVVLGDDPGEVGAGEGPPGQGGGGGREEQRRQPLAAGAGVGPGVGQDQPLGGLGDGAVEEAAGLEEAVLGRREEGQVAGARRLGGGGSQAAGPRARSRRRRGSSGPSTGLGAPPRGGSRRSAGSDESRSSSAARSSSRRNGIGPQHPRVAALHQPGNRQDAEGEPGHRVEGAHVDRPALEGRQRQALPLEAGLEDLLHLLPRGLRGHARRGPRGRRSPPAPSRCRARCRATASHTDRSLSDHTAQALGARERVQGRGEDLHHAEQRLGVADVSAGAAPAAPRRPSRPPRARPPRRPAARSSSARSRTRPGRRG